jgi:hypothetical protein
VQVVPSSNLARQHNGPVMQVHASLHNNQPQTRAGNFPDIFSSMKGFKQPPLVFNRYADPAIADFEDRLGGFNLAGLGGANQVFPS